MTISAVVPDIAFAGSSGAGTLGPFSLVKSGTPIIFYANSEVYVYRYDAVTDTAPTLLVEGTDYTLTGGPDAGSITLTSPQTGLLTAERLYVYTRTSITQALDLVNGGNFSSSNLERRLDIIFQIIQQLDREVKSGIRFAMFDTDEIPKTLPLDAAIDKIPYVTGTAASPTVAYLSATVLADLSELSVETLANIALVAADLAGADTIGIVAASIDDVELVATNVTDVTTVADWIGTGGGLGTGEVTSTGSTTARTLADRFAECVNVLDYGATGDGVADDTAEIQAAITAANATTHKRLYFPAGAYKITAQLLIHSGATWFGDGANKSILAVHSSAGNIVPIKTNTPSGTKNVFDQTDVALYDLHFKGFDAVLTSTAGQTHSALMRLWKIDGLTIERCKFSAHRFIMLSLGGTKNFSITNCEFEDWGRTDELDPSTAAISVSTITSASTTATVTTGSAHGYTTGQSIIIAGATQTEYNGTYTITVTSTTTFTYTFAGSGTSPATGTITCYPQLTLPANEGGAAIWCAANPTDDTPTTLGTMRGNYFHDAEWSCVYLLGQYLDFSFNRMENFKEGNFAASTSIFATELPAESESQNITYIGNFHKGVTERLIQASGFECGGINVIVANNYFEACDGAAFDFTDAAENCVGTGNVCINCATSAYSAEYASIVVRLTNVTTKAVNGITISNNVVRSADDGQHGIRLYRVSGSDTFNNIRVVNNDLVDSAASSVDNLLYDSAQFGTNVVIKDNNGADDYVPASETWTPTIAATSGTITTSSTPTTRYNRVGNMVFFTLSITVTDNGTGAGNLTFTLPSTPLYAGACVGRNASNGNAALGMWTTTNVVSVNTHAAAYPVASGQSLRISGVYMEA